MSSDSVNPGLQGSPLKSRFANDPEMVELIELFVSELPNRIETITGAMSKGEYDNLCRITHQLKGSSAGYGFDPIGTAAGAVEHHLKALGPQADLEQVRREVETLVSLCKRAVR